MDNETLVQSCVSLSQSCCVPQKVMYKSDSFNRLLPQLDSRSQIIYREFSRSLKPNYEAYIACLSVPML